MKRNSYIHNREAIEKLILIWFFGINSFLSFTYLDLSYAKPAGVFITIKSIYLLLIMLFTTYISIISLISRKPNVNWRCYFFLSALWLLLIIYSHINNDMTVNKAFTVIALLFASVIANHKIIKKHLAFSLPLWMISFVFILTGKWHLHVLGLFLFMLMMEVLTIALNYKHKIEINNIVNESAKLKKITEMANKDPLTGVENKRGLNISLNKTISSSIYNDDVFSLIFLDIDYFKRYNDFYGHAKGDNCLIKITQSIKNSVSDNDIVARFGGEEFIIIIKGANAIQCIETCEKIHTNIYNASIEHQKSMISNIVTVSLGVAQWIPGMAGDAIINLADIALYESKRKGRNTFSLYNA